jgi:acetyl esterase
MPHDTALVRTGGRVAPGEAGRVSRPVSGVRDLDTGFDTAAALPTQPPRLPAGVFLAYPTLLAVQPAPDASLRALLDANPAADRFTPANVLAMYENYLGGLVDDAPLPAVPGLAAASDLVGFPPVLMINSEADELRISGEAFAATLAEAGVPLELVIEPGTEHGHLNRPGEPAASASIERVVRWIGTLTTLRTEGIPS